MKLKFTKKIIFFVVFLVLCAVLAFFWFQNKSFERFKVNVRGEKLDTVGNHNGKKIRNCYELGKDNNGLPIYSYQMLSDSGGETRYVKPTDKCPDVANKQYVCDFKIKTGQKGPNDVDGWSQICSYKDPKYSGPF